jgi:hypothetical protein
VLVNNANFLRLVCRHNMAAESDDFWETLPIRDCKRVFSVQRDKTDFVNAENFEFWEFHKFLTFIRNFCERRKVGFLLILRLKYPTIDSCPHTSSTFVNPKLKLQVDVWIQILLDWYIVQKKRERRYQGIQNHSCTNVQGWFYAHKTRGQNLQTCRFCARLQNFSQNTQQYCSIFNFVNKFHNFNFLLILVYFQLVINFFVKSFQNCFMFKLTILENLNYK